MKVRYISIIDGENYGMPRSISTEEYFQMLEDGKYFEVVGSYDFEVDDEVFYGDIFDSL